MTEPEQTPDLEVGGGVTPGDTPPAEATTSGLSEPEPDARHRFSTTGVATIVAVALLVIVFGAAVVAIIYEIAGG
ncbi:DUF6480 family protein [Williamsia serinedens]|nr:DUF6480 family protein [Williamsia serinedens]